MKNLSIVALILLSSCSKSSLQEEAILKTENKPSSVLALCLTPFYRYWSGSDGDHYYTTVQGTYNKYVYEKVECNVNDCQQGSWQPFHKYYSSSTKDHYYTTVQGSYSGYVYEGIACYVLPTSGGLEIPLYQYYNSSIGDHFYTVTPGSYSGYVYEKVACYVYQ